MLKLLQIFRNPAPGTWVFCDQKPKPTFSRPATGPNSLLICQQTLVFLIYCTNFKKKHHTKKCWHHILVLNTLQKGGSTQKDCKILHYATILQIKNCESGEWVEADFLWEDVGNRGKMKNSKKNPKALLIPTKIRGFRSSKYLIYQGFRLFDEIYLKVHQKF